MAGVLTGSTASTGIFGLASTVGDGGGNYASGGSFSQLVPGMSLSISELGYGLGILAKISKNISPPPGWARRCLRLAG